MGCSPGCSDKQLNDELEGGIELVLFVLRCRFAHQIIRRKHSRSGGYSFFLPVRWWRIQ